jgi:hypothetical protein
VNAESQKVHSESPVRNTEPASSGPKAAPSKSRVSFNMKNSDPSQHNTKSAPKAENKGNVSGRLSRPVERQQFRDQITTATADRKISQRIIQKEAFKSFSEQINTKVKLLCIKCSFPKYILVRLLPQIKHP